MNYYNFRVEQKYVLMTISNFTQVNALKIIEYSNLGINARDNNIIYTFIFIIIKIVSRILI